MWSLDGHSKLDFVGIKIYGCIDAYSRKIQWIYVGHSSHTEVSVVRQYLSHVKKLGFMPEILRTDRGTETPMLADAHYTLRVRNDHYRDKDRSCKLPYRNHGGDKNEGLRLDHCYYFGKSTRNLAVESWWGQLIKSTLNPWLVSGT
jgi:hypothetical protein